MAHTDVFADLIEAQSPAYPEAANFLRFMSSHWDAKRLAAMSLRAEKYGPLFWHTFDSAVRDILALYCKYVDMETAGPDMPTIFQDCMRRFTALPHDDHFEDFDEVCAQFYNQPIYPILEHSFYLGLHAVDRLGRVLELLAHLPDHGVAAQEGRVLCDVAVGPAVIYTSVLEHLGHWRGTAYDISQHCVDYARDVLALHHITPDRAEVKLADARKLPAANDSFDLVLATEIIEHVPHPSELLAEIRRVLKPGGTLIASVPINLPWGPHLVVFSNETEIKSLFAAASFDCREFLIDGLPQEHALTYGLFTMS